MSFFGPIRRDNLRELVIRYALLSCDRYDHSGSFPQHGYGENKNNIRMPIPIDSVKMYIAPDIIRHLFCPCTVLRFLVLYCIHKRRKHG